jgi:hypothetical protein
MVRNRTKGKRNVAGSKESVIALISAQFIIGLFVILLCRQAQMLSFAAI